MISHEFLVAETLNNFSLSEVMRLATELRTNADYLPLSVANRLCTLALLYTANDDAKTELLKAADEQYKRSYDAERGAVNPPKKVCKSCGKWRGRARHN